MKSVEFYFGVGGFDKGIINLCEESNSSVIFIESIPSFMIPSDILKFFTTLISNVTSFRIIQKVDQTNNDSFSGILFMNSIESAQELFNSFQNVELTSLQSLDGSTMCLLHYVSDISLFCGDCSEENYSSFSARIHRFGYFSDSKFSLSKQCLYCPMFTATESDNENSVRNYVGHTSNTERNSLRYIDITCALCLEQLFQDEVQANYNSICWFMCNHSFHVRCVLKLENSQCPVCRYDHMESYAFTSCGTCGVSLSSSTMRGEGTYTPALSHGIRGLWCCLVCGYVGCGVDHENHITSHYNNTFHTYAINLANQHVWDFAGGGFVNRLITSYNNSSSSSKVIEVNHGSEYTRSLNPEYLSLEEENFVVHSELEVAALQFKRISQNQLEQCERMYTLQLEKLQSSLSEPSSINLKKSNILKNIHSEKSKLMHQIQSLKSEQSEIVKDIEVYERLNDILQRNISNISLKTTELQDKCETEEIKHGLLMKPLEERLNELMSLLVDSE